MGGIHPASTMFPNLKGSPAQKIPLKAQQLIITNN